MNALLIKKISDTSFLKFLKDLSIGSNVPFSICRSLLHTLQLYSKLVN